MIQIQNGTIDDFFNSTLQTAKQIDNQEKIIPKYTRREQVKTKATNENRHY